LQMHYPEAKDVFHDVKRLKDSGTVLRALDGWLYRT